MGKSSRQKINEETQELNCTTYQMDSTDIYRTFSPTTAECLLFSIACGMFSRTDHMISHKTTLNKL
jgi:hypothetical protein